MDDTIPVKLKMGAVNTPFADYVFDLRGQRKLSRFLMILLQAYYYDEGTRVLVDKYMESNIKVDMTSVHVDTTKEEKHTTTESEMASLVKLGELGQLVDSLQNLLEPVTNFNTALKAMRTATNELGAIRDDLGGITMEQLPALLKQKDNTTEILKSMLDKEMEMRMAMFSQPQQIMPMYQPQYMPMQPMYQPPREEGKGVLAPSEPMNGNTHPVREEVEGHNVQPMPDPVVPPIVQQQAEVQPVAPQPITPQPVVQQPVAPQPVVQQPVAPQPVVQQPVVQSEEEDIDPMALFRKSASSVLSTED